MPCKNPDCPNKDCPNKKEDQSTKAFREYVEANPARLESKVYDV